MLLTNFIAEETVEKKTMVQGVKNTRCSSPDLDSAEDVCLLSNHMDRAQELLSRVESECVKVGLFAECQENQGDHL